MKIIIVGGGKAGIRLIKALTEEGHDVILVDPSTERVNEVCDMHDVMGVVGNGLNYSSLSEAGLDTADLLICVTGKDEQNLLCALLAKKTPGCSTIARVRNPVLLTERQFLKEEIGLSMIINPELASAIEISRILRFPSAIDINPFSKGKIEMLTLRIPEGSILDGKNLTYVRSKIENGVLFCIVERGEEYFIPTGNFELKAGDKASVILKSNDEFKFFKRINLASQRIKDVIIAGGGMISYYLAKELIKNNMNVKIIEIDERRCNELVELLPNALIIHGDASDRDLLLEEGIDKADAFIALTGFDEENIVLSLYAKELSDIKVVTKIDKIVFTDLISKLNLDSIIYPNDIVSQNILQYARAKQNALGNNIETLYKLVEDKVEAMEFVISENAPNLGIPLKDLDLKDNVLVCVINRAEDVIFPDGNTTIQAGDRVVIVTNQKQLNDYKDIFR